MLNKVFQRGIRAGARSVPTAENLMTYTKLFGLALASAVLVALAASASAAPPEGMRWGDTSAPWSSRTSHPSRPAATDYVPQPQRSTLQYMAYPKFAPEAVPAGYPVLEAPVPAGGAVVVAHLMPGADMWLGGVQMVSDAYKPTHEVRFPSLDTTGVYHLTAMVRWVEDGKWVSQTHTFALRAGETHCVSLTVTADPAVKKETEANLAKLAPAERAAAESQKFCAVQETIRLGSMGPPVKVAVGGKDVYLCCEGCRTAALKDADKTLKVVKKLKGAD